jgi:hypothetical protein
MRFGIWEFPLFCKNQGKLTPTTTTQFSVKVLQKDEFVKIESISIT